MNDVGFPVSRVLDGIDAAAAAGLQVKVNAVVKRGVNDDQIVALARHFRGTRPHPPLHRVHGRRRDERLAARRRRPGRRDRRARSTPSCRSSRPRRTTAARSRGAGATATAAARSASSPPSRSRSAATAPARASRPRVGSTRACSPRAGHDLRALVRGGADDAELHETIGRIWGRRTDRYSEDRSSRTAELPRVEMSYIGG